MFDFSLLLILHSYFRWVILVVMIIQGIWIGKNYFQGKIFTPLDFNILLCCTCLFNIQLILGWVLYLNSTIVEVFWQDVSKSIKIRQVRFFGIEHMSMMSLAILLINISTFQMKKYIHQDIAFKKLFKFYIVIYLIILSSIPWSFSPLTSRPDFR